MSVEKRTLPLFYVMKWTGANRFCHWMTKPIPIDASECGGGATTLRLCRILHNLPLTPRNVEGEQPLVLHKEKCQNFTPPRNVEGGATVKATDKMSIAFTPPRNLDGSNHVWVVANCYHPATMPRAGARLPLDALRGADGGLTRPEVHQAGMPEDSLTPEPPINPSIPVVSISETIYVSHTCLVRGGSSLTPNQADFLAFPTLGPSWTISVHYSCPPRLCQFGSLPRRRQYRLPLPTRALPTPSPHRILPVTTPYIQFEYTVWSRGGYGGALGEGVLLRR